MRVPDNVIGPAEDVKLFDAPEAAQTPCDASAQDGWMIHPPAKAMRRRRISGRAPHSPIGTPDAMAALAQGPRCPS